MLGQFYRKYENGVPQTVFAIKAASTAPNSIIKTLTGCGGKHVVSDKRKFYFIKSGIRVEDFRNISA